MSEIADEYEQPDESADVILSEGEQDDPGSTDDGRDDYPAGFTGPTDGAGPDDEQEGTL